MPVDWDLIARTQQKAVWSKGVASVGLGLAFGKDDRGTAHPLRLAEDLALQLLFLHLLSFQMRVSGGSLVGTPPK